MSLGLVGTKCGMTRVFTPEGVSIPVTVIKIDTNRVTQIKTVENDGYSAVQLTMGSKHPNRVNKPLAGHYAKADVAAGEGLWEFRLSPDESAELHVGSVVELSILEAGQKVDVRGISRGKGFAGTVKRHNFRTQDATHGNSLSHRVPGSTGQNQTPGRVFVGKKMAGHMGNVNCSVLNQEIVRVDADKGLLLVKGGVPGAPGGKVIVMLTVKKQGETK